MAEKLIERGISVVRIGNPAKTTDELLGITWEAKYHEHPYYADVLSCKEIIKQLKADCSKTPSRDSKKRKELNRKIKEYVYYRSILEMSIKSAILKENKVIAATMIGSALQILKGITFTTVFIDEAAQALEPACWTPITKAKRVIFAGDHKQLPPTVKSYEAAQNGLMHTLFEKIIEKKPECSILLTMQYRMHETIMNFSSQRFYEGQLTASPSVMNQTLVNNDIPIEWIDTPHAVFHENKQNAGTSIYNTEEAHLLFTALFDFMEKIGEARILDEKITIGIISPYSAQVDLFREKIKEYNYFEKFISAKLITIRTIDGFQGQERDVIAISLVRSNSRSKIGFLADYRRINVAMTRAKKKLLIIGDSSTLCKDPFFEALFSYVQKNGAVTSMPDDEYNKQLEEIITDFREKYRSDSILITAGLPTSILNRIDEDNPTQPDMTTEYQNKEYDSMTDEKGMGDISKKEGGMEWKRKGLFIHFHKFFKKTGKKSTE
jgi:superfamily I DNA and/or RNA helicase